MTALVAEVVLRQMAHMERVVRAAVEVFLDLGRGEVPELAVVVVQLALFEDHFDVEVLEVVDDGEVSQIARRDGAAVIEQEVTRGMVARDLDGDDGVDAIDVDGLLDDIINVALFQKIGRVLVVSAEHAALGILRREQRRKRLKVARGRALAHHDELAPAEFFQSVGGCGALVVGVYARRDVSI